MKSNYFYIDETGHINNDSPIFVFGCIKTDTPNMIDTILQNTKEELSSDKLLMEFGTRLIDNNFHATGDPADVRTAMFRLLPYMSFRSYFYVLLKSGEYYSTLKKERKDHEIIEMMLKKLIKSKLEKHREEMNYFYFETLEVQGKKLTKILKSIFDEFSELKNFEYHIVGKECQNMPIIDYMNFTLNKILTCDVDEALPDWLNRTFNAIKDKMGLVFIYNDRKYYSRFGDENDNINLQNLKSRMAVERDKS